MKVKWLGHSSFLLTSDQGTRVVIDPYTSGGPISYGTIEETAEIVTVSHEHGDHSNVATVKGNPEVVKGTGAKQVSGIEINGVGSFHDAEQGSQRGANTIFCMGIDGVRVCHLGDLGHPLSDQAISDIGGVDVLLVPIGGHFTIDAAAATEVCNKLNPRVVIPMHYKTAKCAFPIEDAQGFLSGRANVRTVDDSEVELNKAGLPQATETIVLKYAM
ncbi:MAG: MBL fold metallo-hydrolase [Dehalococcoidia bacterium]